MSQTLKKFGVFVVVLGLAVTICTGCGKKEEKNYLEEITLSDYLELINDKETTLVYVDSNDDVSAKFRKSLNTILNDLDYKMKYVDTTKFKSDEESMKFMNADEKTKGSYDVPMIISFKNGKIKEIFSGYTKDEAIKTFISANK